MLIMGCDFHTRYQQIARLGWPILAGFARVGTQSRKQKLEVEIGKGTRLTVGSWWRYGRGISSCLQMAHGPFLDFAMAWDAGDLVQRGVEPNAMGSTLAIQNATMEPQMAFQFREFHASAISKTSRTACGERPFSASSRWHCSASFSASARFALASSMVSPCEIAAGNSSTKQV